MTDETLSPEDQAVLFDVVMILAEGRVMADKRGVLNRWRRCCEWVIKHRAAKPEVRERSAVLVRGLFAHGKKLRS